MSEEDHADMENLIVTDLFVLVFCLYLIAGGFTVLWYWMAR